MSVRSAQSVTVLFTTRNATTGVGVNADSLPAGTLYLNGASNAASVTVTNVSTGLYKAAVTLPTLAVNDWVEIIIAATVNSVADSCVVWGDTKDVFAGAIPDVAAAASGGLPTVGTGSGQINPDGTGSVPVAFGTAIPSAPTANTVGEALYMADATRGRFGTAQGGTSTTITLDAGASAVDGRYVGYTCMLSGGTGGGLPGTVGQERTIVAYVGATKVATVAQAWGTTPDATTVFKLVVQPKVDVYMWAGDNAGIAVDANHYPSVSAKYWGGTLIVASSIPVGTAAGAASGLAIVGSAMGDSSGVTTLLSRIGGSITISGGFVTANMNGDFTATQKASIGTAVAASAVASVTGNVGGDLTGKVLGGGASAFTAVGVQADIEQIGGNTGGVTRLDRSARAIVTGTVGSASTTTSIVTSALSPSAAVTDQFKGRIVIFDKDTTTANLRGQATDITGSSSGGVLTVSALTTAPVSTDTFTIT